MADAVEQCVPTVAAPVAASAAAAADGEKPTSKDAGRDTDRKKERRGGCAAKKESKPKKAAADDDDDGSTTGQRSRVPKCKECHKDKNDLFRDKKDGKLYCASCWKKWYKRGPPANARFVQGAARSAKAAPQKEEEEPAIPTQPIAPENVDVDQFYEAVLQEGAPSVFVGKDKIAWSVMLKGANDRFGYALLQLVTHDDCCVVYSRTGRVNEGADNAKETYHEFKGIAEAKDKFCDIFFDFTQNKFDDVKRCVTKFVTRGEYTLTADVKAARRAENEANRLAREAKEQKMMQERNAQIVATAKAELGVESAPEATKKPKKPTSDANLSQPGIRPEDRRKSPKPAPIETGGSSPNNQEDGELSPAEPPCTPAVAPQAAPAAVSPRPKPSAAPKKPVQMPTPPAAPRAGPAAPPPKSLEPKPAAASAPAPAASAAPGKKKKMMAQDDEPQSSNAPLMIAGVVAIAAAAAGFMFMRKQ